jgi:hypothetical protein
MARHRSPPLAWGRLADDGPAIQARCGRLVAESTVHFEAWAMQALAEALDADLTVPIGPHSERDLRTQLERSRPDLRQRGLAALDRLERCRSGAARAAGPGALDEALGDLDRAFEELTAGRRAGQDAAGPHDTTGYHVRPAQGQLGSGQSDSL